MRSYSVQWSPCRTRSRETRPPGHSRDRMPGGFCPSWLPHTYHLSCLCDCGEVSACPVSIAFPTRLQHGWEYGTSLAHRVERSPRPSTLDQWTLRIAFHRGCCKNGLVGWASSRLSELPKVA